MSKHEKKLKKDPNVPINKTFFFINIIIWQRMIESHDVV